MALFFAVPKSATAFLGLPFLGGESSEATPATPENPAVAPTPAPETAPSVYCPLQAELHVACSLREDSRENLFTGEGAVDPWAKPYVREDRCRLSWWSQQVQEWSYPPLAEWAGYLNDALVERLDLAAVTQILGSAPEPPSALVNSRQKPSATCRKASGEEAKKLSELLQRLNLRQITSAVMDQLVSHCLAFNVGTAIWMRVGSAATAAYVMPIGNLNFMFLAQPSITVANSGITESFDDSLRDPAAVKTVITAVGTCPVRTDPRLCLEGYLRENDRHISYGFDGNFVRTIPGLPFRADLESMYRGGKNPYPRPLEVHVNQKGRLFFSYNDKRGESAPLKPILDKGVLALQSDEETCEVNRSLEKKIVYRPLAFPSEAEALYRNVAFYRPDDFPEPKDLEKTGIEKGCASGQKYSEWAADTANAAKHYLHHGMALDELYRSIANQRFRFRIEGKGLPKLSERLTYGVWRTSPVEVSLPKGHELEAQAEAFAKGGTQTKDSNIAFRTKIVDDIASSEIWYYQKPITLQLGKPKSHVLIRSLNSANQLFAKGVIERVNLLLNSCANRAEQKRELLNGFYALLNAAPLEQGDEIVSKIFFAAVYQNIFGEKLKKLSEFANVQYDALTLQWSEFSDKYLPFM